MKVGSVGHLGDRASFTLAGEGISATVELGKRDAELLACGLLTALAGMDPVNWQRISDEARDVRRSPLAAAAGRNGRPM